MANTLLDVQDTFISLDENYDTLFVACQNDAEQDALKARYVAAETAYYKCLNHMLEDDDEAVAEIDTQLQAANLKVKAAVAFMGTMSKVIDDIDEALQFGAKLMVKAGL